MRTLFESMASPLNLGPHREPLPLWARGQHGVHLSEVPVRTGGRRPDFIVIGAAKAGTTSLHHYLDGHPELSMCPYKEPHFFSTDAIYERGMAWYEGLFADCDETTLCGEASTSYTFGPQAAQAPARIHEHVPDAKLIYLMREPVARLHSEVMQGLKYSQHVLGEAERPRSIEEAIAAHPSTLHAGRYIEQLERYLELFPREQVLVVLHEDLVYEPRATLARIFEFLGVDPSHRADTDVRHNVTAGYVEGRQNEIVAEWARRHVPRFDWARRYLPASVKDSLKAALRRGLGSNAVVQPLAPQQLAALYDYYRPCNERLAAFLGRDLSHWARPV